MQKMKKISSDDYVIYVLPYNITPAVHCMAQLLQFECNDTYSGYPNTGCIRIPDTFENRTN
jgi:hypothetical protein